MNTFLPGIGAKGPFKNKYWEYIYWNILIYILSQKIMHVIQFYDYVFLWYITWNTTTAQLAYIFPF
jgi:hypothetical protein